MVRQRPAHGECCVNPERFARAHVFEVTAVQFLEFQDTAGALLFVHAAGEVANPA
jgi:hypothetical protein